MPGLLLAICLCLCPGAQAAELVVSAAASLTNALRETGRLFEAGHPPHKVALNFASSDVLLSQIVRGAPVDVFAAADAESMDRAEKQGLLAAGTRRVLARNKLVLIAPAGAGAVDDLEALERAAVRRIAIGNPASVPAGRYAREALQAAGLWPGIAGKLVFAQNVRQALDYVARGEADAGIVYATDAAIMRGKVRVAVALPTPTPIVYPIAVVGETRHRTLAETFLAFQQAEPTRAVFARHGFERP